ncbi:MAG: ATP synthase F0 subunit B, partial [Lentisphaerae bacterium]|nr:ATP synthase F0 subunit B [Lentisphaerota bacterium]
MELSPDIGLAVWTLLTFLLLIAFLSRFALKPLRKVLETREAMIRESLEKSEEARKEAERLLADGGE